MEAGEVAASDTENADTEEEPIETRLDDDVLENEAEDGGDITEGLADLKNGSDFLDENDKGDSEQNIPGSESDSSIKEAKSEVTEGTKNGEDSSKKKETLLSDELNLKPVHAEKKNEKPVVTFTDGSVITEADIMEDLKTVPEYISLEMPLTRIKSFLAWKRAYKKILNAATKQSKVAESDEVKRLVKKRKLTAAGFMLIDEKAKELMTFDALKHHYDEIWDKNFKGTKEFSLVAITTTNKSVADTIRNSVKSEDSLKKMIESNISNTKSMDMNNRPASMFPPEISKTILDQGVNTVVGPFEVKGAFMLFYVKSIKDAQKKEFNEEFAEEYKNVALKDFIKDYFRTLYKKYDVKIFDINKNVVDTLGIMSKPGEAKGELKEEVIKKISDLKDEEVFATFKGGKATIGNLKEFFKVTSLLDDVFVSMSQQFGISLEEVIVYAVKLVVDDGILTKEVSELKYDKRPEIIGKLAEIEEMELQHAYFKKNVVVKPEDVKKTFTNFMKSIPEEEKNDNEVSVRLIFFPKKEDAVKELSSIAIGEKKFTPLFDDKIKKKEAIDLGYVRKQGVVPELWDLLKRGAAGACCKEIVELESEQFGISGMDYAVVYIMDKRKIPLPSLSGENEKKYFGNLAMREKAIELAKTLLAKEIKTIEGKSIKELDKNNPEHINKMLSLLVVFSG
jgi:hypothetical protein